MTQSKRPLQRIPYTEKVKDNYKWAKETIEYYLGDCPLVSSVSNSIATNNAEINYHIANNNIPEEWFHYVTNPLNSDAKSGYNFPARIRAYNIIIPNIDLYMGEFIKRVFKYQVLNKSEDGYKSFIEEKEKVLYENIKQHFINYLIEAGLGDPADYREIQLPEDVEKEFLSSYQDQLAVKGQDALEYIDSDKRTYEIFKKCFFDWLVAGEVHTYKNIVRGDIEYERVNPLDIYSDFGPDINYGEDGNYTIRRKLVSISDLVDNFYDEMTKDQITTLENESNFSGSAANFYRSLTDNSVDTSDKVYLYHVCWKSYKIIKILTYTDDFGQIEQMEVDETYVPDKDLGESVEEQTITEWWEGYKVYNTSINKSDRNSDKKDYDDYYFRIRPIPVQRYKMNSRSTCKGPYNSVYFRNENSLNTSVVQLGIPYLILYIIVTYKLELTIAKDKGKIVLMPLDHIPNHGDWDEEKFFYYSEANGYALIDPSQRGSGFNQYQVLDMSLFKDISKLIEIKDSIARDYDELLGITRQRKGQTSASETATGINNAVINSSIISEYIFDKFDDWRRAEYEGLLDMAGFAYIEGKKGLYYGSDFRNKLLEIHPGDFLNSELGVVVSRSPRDKEKLANLTAYAQAFSQNGASPSTVAKIIDADSITSITKTLEEIEEVQRQRDESAAKSEQEAELMKIEREKEFEQFKHMLNLDILQKENDRLDNREYIKGEIEAGIEEIKAGSNEDSSSLVEDAYKNSIEREKIMNDRASKLDEKSLKERELNIKEKEVDVKKYQADTSLEIAKENRNKYDKKS